MMSLGISSGCEVGLGSDLVGIKEAIVSAGYVGEEVGSEDVNSKESRPAILLYVV
jgi:hypothetical protein